MEEMGRFKMFTGDITNEEAVEYYKSEIDMQLNHYKMGLISSTEMTLLIRGFNFAWISINVDFYDKYLDPYWREKRLEVLGY